MQASCQPKAATFTPESDPQRHIQGRKTSHCDAVRHLSPVQSPSSTTTQQQPFMRACDVNQDKWTRKAHPRPPVSDPQTNTDQYSIYNSSFAGTGTAAARQRFNQDRSNCSLMGEPRNAL